MPTPDVLPPTGVQWINYPLTGTTTWNGVTLTAPGGVGLYGTAAIVEGKQIIGAHINGLSGGTVSLVGSSDPVHTQPTDSHVEPLLWNPIMQDPNSQLTIAADCWLNPLCQLARWLGVLWVAGAGPLTGVLRIGLIDPFKL